MIDTSSQARLPEYPLYYQEINWDLVDEDRYNFMEFRLMYEGPLKAASNSNTRVKEKHAIRKQFHTQLAELWRNVPQLQFWAKKVQQPFPDDPVIPLSWAEDDEEGEDLPLLPLINSLNSQREERKRLFERARIRNIGETYLETLASRYTRNGFRFVPLVHSGVNLVCGLDVLFLRRDNPGALIRSGGDIDNRIKVLLDALKMPKDGSELGTAIPGENEIHFFAYWKTTPW